MASLLTAQAMELRHEAGHTDTQNNLQATPKIVLAFPDTLVSYAVRKTMCNRVTFEKAP